MKLGVHSTKVNPIAIEWENDLLHIHSKFNHINEKVAVIIIILCILHRLNVIEASSRRRGDNTAKKKKNNQDYKVFLINRSGAGAGLGETDQL